MHRSLIFAGALIAAALAGVDGSAHSGVPGVTWTGTVSRILERRCVGCHGAAGGTAPLLDGYDVARAAAPLVKQAVLARRMPRWDAVAGFGDFANDTSLTADEIQHIADWVDAGAPRGEDRFAAHMPLPVHGAPPPDVTLRSAAKHLIRDRVHTFDLPTGLDGEHRLRGWAMQPGNAALVRGATLSLSSGATIGTWVPGEPATFFPDGVARRLPAGVVLRLTVHYRKPHGLASDASSVALYFTDRPGRDLRTLRVPCGTAALPRAADILAIRPAPGFNGQSLTALLRRADGGLEPMGVFRNVAANHPQTYRYGDPVGTGEGASLQVAGAGPGCGVELDYVATAAAGDAIAHHHVETPEPAGAPHAGASGYRCPMHPDVRAEIPGTCPICRMTLVGATGRIEGAYRLQVTARPSSPRRHDLRLLVREPGSTAIVRRLETVHERPFHLFVVSDDLEEFAHLHPVPQPDGALTLAGVPISSTASRLFADFLPADGTPQLVSRALPTAARLAAPPATLAVDLDDKVDAGLRVTVQPEGTLVAGIPTLIGFAIADASTGLPVTDLEPYLGAAGHLFLVSADLVDAVHSHPLTAPPDASTITFRQRFPRPGLYRLWAQFQRAGRVATVSFTVSIAASR